MSVYDRVSHLCMNEGVIYSRQFDSSGKLHLKGILVMLSPRFSQTQVGSATGFQLEQGKAHSQVPGAIYFLPASEEESRRLKMQHALLTRTLGGLIQAPIKPLRDGDAVLESATGTGSWLLELASRSPEGAQFIGIDVEPQRLPNPRMVPPNVIFQVRSVLDLPQEWTGRFAFVHQRLLIAGLQKAEWPIVMSEFYRVLRPGGWVQLTEIENWVAGPFTREAQRLINELGISLGTEAWPGMTVKLKEYLEASGFANVQLAVHSTPVGMSAGQDGKDTRNIAKAVFFGVKQGVLNRGGFGIVSDDKSYVDLALRMETEMEASRDGRLEWAVAYAQKPNLGENGC